MNRKFLLPEREGPTQDKDTASQRTALQGVGGRGEFAAGPTLLLALGQQDELHRPGIPPHSTPLFQGKI